MCSNPRSVDMDSAPVPVVQNSAVVECIAVAAVAAVAVASGSSFGIAAAFAIVAVEANTLAVH